MSLSKKELNELDLLLELRKQFDKDNIATLKTGHICFDTAIEYDGDLINIIKKMLIGRVMGKENFLITIDAFTAKGKERLKELNNRLPNKQEVIPNMLDGLALSLGKLTSSLLSNKDQYSGKLVAFDSPKNIKWHANLLYSPELEYFYKNYGFDFCGIGDWGIGLISHSALPWRQEGYGLSKEWLVFADMNDDPIVVNTQAKGSPVSAAIEAIDYKVISPSLDIFFTLCALSVENTAYFKKYEPDPHDDECSGRSGDIYDGYLQYHNNVVSKAFLEKASHILNDEHLANVEEFFYS